MAATIGRLDPQEVALLGDLAAGHDQPLPSQLARDLDIRHGRAGAFGDLLLVTRETVDSYTPTSPGISRNAIGFIAIGP